MRTRALPFAAVLIALSTIRPASAGAQHAPLAAAVGVMAASDTTLDPAVAAEIEAARARGLPAEPLLAKVREGRLKRASTPRIRVAVAALAARLDTAKAALGGDASEGELVAGADALAAGADATAVRAVTAATRVRPVSAPLGALAQLVASGVPPARAAAMIVDLMRRNATPAQMVAFGNSVESDAAGGLPGEESARFRWREFGAGSAAGTTTNLDAFTPGTGSTHGTTSPAPPPPRRRP